MIWLIAITRLLRFPFAHLRQIVLIAEEKRDDRAARLLFHLGQTWAVAYGHREALTVFGRALALY
ncbi:hypothetical protein, partial [Roseiflexus sp.]